MSLKLLLKVIFSLLQTFHDDVDQIVRNYFEQITSSDEISKILNLYSQNKKPKSEIGIDYRDEFREAMMIFN
jgi:hypothetical protein